MKLAVLFVGAAAYETEWAEYQAAQGQNGGEIPEAFKATVDLVKAHNAKESTYKLQYTGPMAAMTPEEYKQMLGYKPSNLHGDMPKLATHVHSGKAAVASIDWSTQGAVTPVKNQGQCGSCWAFSSTGGTEGQWALATANLKSLSEQQLVDCSKANGGCQGGLMDAAFTFYKTTAIAEEDSYPYKAKNGKCKTSFTTAIPEGAVTGFVDISDETDLLDAVTNNGPVSVAIEADQSSFGNYGSGVLTGTCGTQLDHGVLAVGFGTLSGTDYWKVKNSWGASWGMDGYVLIERGNNKCGIASGPPSYPTVDGSAPPAPPSPPTPAPAPSTTHYGQAPCQDDEMEGQFKTGSICAAACDSDAACPTDVDESCTKPKPKCQLTDQSGAQYCALTCSLLGGNCPDGAKCSSIFGGICSYPAATNSATIFDLEETVTV